MEKGYRIGIDLGGTNIVVGLVGPDNTLADKISVKTAVPRPVTSMAEDMAAMVDDLLTRHGQTKADILSAGVGVPGTANEETGHIDDADNLGFGEEPFVGVLEE